MLNNENKIPLFFQTLIGKNGHSIYKSPKDLNFSCEALNNPLFISRLSTTSSSPASELIQYVKPQITNKSINRVFTNFFYWFSNTVLPLLISLLFKKQVFRGTQFCQPIQLFYIHLSRNYHSGIIGHIKLSFGYHSKR